MTKINMMKLKTILLTTFCLLLLIIGSILVINHYTKNNNVYKLIKVYKYHENNSNPTIREYKDNLINTISNSNDLEKIENIFTNSKKINSLCSDSEYIDCLLVPSYPHYVLEIIGENNNQLHTITLWCHKLDTVVFSYNNDHSNNYYKLLDSKIELFINLIEPTI